MKIETKITGDEELKRKLKELENKSEELLKKVIVASAIEVEGRAKEKCPVLTNRLRSSITHQIIEGGKGARVGTNVAYSLHVEFGTKPHLAPIEAGARAVKKYGLKKKGLTFLWVTGKAQPFLIPALAESKKYILNLIQKAYKKLGEK